MKSSCTILALFISIFISAQEIVEFRGVERSGHYNETGLLKEWGVGGPQLISIIEGVGKGYSQPILVDETIFVSGIKHDTVDVLSAFSSTGKLLWDVPYGRSWTRSYIDSRSTPTFCNGKLYVSSGTGQLNCIDAKSGKILWNVDVIDNYAGKIYLYGDAEAPLLVNNLVVFITGGEENTMVAFNKDSGDLVWKTKSVGGAKSYASPTLINHNGKEIILAQTAENLMGINSVNGELLWSFNIIAYHENSRGKGGNTNPPIYYNNGIFVTSGYDHPGLMFTLSEDGNAIQLKWRNDDFDNHHGGVVLVDGNIYGANWQHNSRGKWMSVNWETGKTNWENEWINKGSIITADNLLYLYEEKRGNVALAEPSMDSLKIVSSFKVEHGVGPYWAHPAIYNGKLFIRHGDVLMIYDIKE